MLSVFCIYSDRGLIEQIVDVFAPRGAELHLWALGRPLRSVAQWTRGSGGGAKYGLLNRLLEYRRRGQLVLFTDDDIGFLADFPDRYSDAVHALKFDLAQPSLTHDSFHAHYSTIQRSWLTGRRTNRVEQMVFSMSARLLDLVTPFPDLGWAGWAQEFLWAKEAREHGWNVGIIDRHPVRHSFRPIGAGYDRRLARDEMRRALAALGLAYEPITTLDTYPPGRPMSALTGSFSVAIQNVEPPTMRRIMEQARREEEAAVEYGGLCAVLPETLGPYMVLALCALDHAERIGDCSAARTRERLAAARSDELERFVLEAMDIITWRAAGM